MPAAMSEIYKTRPSSCDTLDRKYIERDDTMKYCNTLIAVKDMPAALRFYKDLFDQEVITDLGWCKVLSCGLTLQEHFDEIAGFPAESMRYRSNTMELYFETEDFDAFQTLLDAHPEVERLHEAREFPWLQRGIRLFDPDGHLIEVSESMYTVACRQFDAGKDPEETAALIQHPLPVVQAWHARYQEASRRLHMSVCGTDCSVCACYGELCPGCHACSGKVFHAPEGSACAIYDCVVNTKGLKDCGACSALPCPIWMQTRDPSFSDAEFEKNIRTRIQTLKSSKD